jgi:predicted DNA binding CopG/RHH family protein
MTMERMNDEQLAEEARRWDAREITPAEWEDAPEAVPRAKESMQINIRLPCAMVAILKEFARRSGIGYQVLMKRWLDERSRQERHRFQQEQEHLRREHGRAQPTAVIQLSSPAFVSQAASFDASNVRHLPVNSADAKSP